MKMVVHVGLSQDCHVNLAPKAEGARAVLEDSDAVASVIVFCKGTGERANAIEPLVHGPITSQAA